ncbi:hypothetical protein [Bartonella sp. HY406]|uniref:hypothetical protein n=1 Tax=Bartonella sp. HY406 TaxID=2979331 RepID=UPI0021CA9DAC|nr:hypothetical protein [Bartonella sp. HY406]UXN04190.1 hypothetical protein N6B01_03925 [Bartonella sp. HY406]
MKKKWLLIPLGIVVLIGAALWGGDKYLYSLAYDEFVGIAVEKYGCEGSECDEPITYAIEALKEKQQLSERQVMRCRGAAIVEEKKFVILDGVKNQIAAWIIETCDNGEASLDDATIEFYDGSGSHGE